MRSTSLDEKFQKSDFENEKRGWPYSVNHPVGISCICSVAAAAEDRSQIGCDFYTLNDLVRVTRCFIFLLNSATGKKIPRVARPPPPPPHSSTEILSATACIMVALVLYNCYLFFSSHSLRSKNGPNGLPFKLDRARVLFFFFLFCRSVISEHRYASRNKRERSNYLKTISSPPPIGGLHTTPRRIVADAARRRPKIDALCTRDRVRRPMIERF